MGFMRPYRPISRRSQTRESSSSLHLQVPWTGEMAVAMFPVSVPPTDHSTDFVFDPQADSLGYIWVLFSRVRSPHAEQELNSRAPGDSQSISLSSDQEII